MSKHRIFEPSGFAKTIEKTGNYVTDTTLIYKWTGTHWEPLKDAIAMRMAVQWLEKGKHGTVNAANAQATVKTALLWLPLIDEPSEITVVPLRNGYLHFDGSLTLKPAEKELGLRHVLSCEYEPTAPAPTEFTSFLERILPDIEVRNRVQEYVGYTLLPDTRYQRAQFWIGTGANGKGVLASVVQALHKQCAAAQIDALDGFLLENMIGASLIYCDEAPQHKIQEKRLKELIAGSVVQINRKYRDVISTSIKGKWLILGNHIPDIADHSPGFWRRFDLVPFSVEIPEGERDALLAKRIIERELSGVLNWALEGLLRLQARGRFDPSIPTAMLDLTKAARLETDSIQAWVHSESIERTSTIETPKEEVYTSYSTWCKRNGMFQLSSPKFWSQLPQSIGSIHQGRVLRGRSRPHAVNVKI